MFLREDKERGAAFQYLKDKLASKRMSNASSTEPQVVSFGSNRIHKGKSRWIAEARARMNLDLGPNDYAKRDLQDKFTKHQEMGSVIGNLPLLHETGGDVVDRRDSLSTVQQLEVDS